MGYRGRYQTRIRVLFIIFLISLMALILSLCALVVVQRDEQERYLQEMEARREAAYEASSLLREETSVTEPPEGTAASSEQQGELISESEAHLDADPGEITAADTFYLLPEELRLSRERAGMTDEILEGLAAEQEGNYYFSRLNEEEAALYTEILFIITHHENDIYISTTDADMLEKVQNCVMNDHPEIFYVSGYYSTRYTIGDETVGFSFSGRYMYTAEEIEERQKKIDAYIETCLAGVPEGADDYTKIKYIYEYIIRNTSYDLEAPDNQNICSVMITNVSVCQGYAKAVQLLLNKLDIPATLVVGMVKTQRSEGPHAWNLVMADGAWYYLDVTWGDGQFQNAEGVSEGTNYDYLLTTSTDISYTHTIGSVVEMPLCTEIKDNYYVRENAYFTEASLQAFGELVERRSSENAPSVTFKCATDEVYEQMIYELVDCSAIFNYIHKAPGESLAFSRSDEHRSFTVWF